MRRLSLLLLALVALVHAQPEVTPKLDEIASGWSRERGFMGSVLVARQGKVVLEKGYGLANLEWDVPNTPDTKFRLGSITKQFTATAILQLQEKGKLSLEDSVTKYLPEAPEGWKPITIHHLLNHTSGIPSYTGLKEFSTPKMMRVPLTPVEIVNLTRDKKLEFQPGENWKYNNTGYVLLGHIIEAVTGLKYDAVLKENIFDPLDMKDSGYDWTRPLLKKRASGYAYNRGTRAYTNAAFLDMSLPHAAGSLYSTVKDLYLWDRALAAGKLLNTASFERMYTVGRKDYAYGWGVTTVNGRRQIGHGGGINGFSTMIQRFPGEDAVVIVLSNVENGDASGLARVLASALFGEKVELPWERKAIEVDPKILSRYTGVYQLEPFRVTVTLENGKLMLQPDGQPKLEVLPMSETTFFTRVVDAVFEFSEDSMVLKQGGAELRGKRVTQ